MPKLSETRTRILKHLAGRDENRDGCPSAREIAEACGEHRRASDWAHGPLREMARDGFCETVGATFDNARTWRITAAGRTVLSSGTPE